MADEIPEDVVDTIRTYIEEYHGFLSWLDVDVEAVERDRTVMTLPYDEKLTNNTSPETIHGGVAATLIDTCGGLALRPHLDDPVGGGMATVNLNVNYLRRAVGDLRATAEPIRAGGSVGWSNITVESEVPSGETKPVVVGQAAYRLFHGD
jgi:uncharacterized protein (TIGR00369 family)